MNSWAASGVYVCAMLADSQGWLPQMSAVWPINIIRRLHGCNSGLRGGKKARAGGAFRPHRSSPLSAASRLLAFGQPLIAVILS